MPSGITASTPGNLVLNVAVLYIAGTITGATPGGTKFGPTQGGIDFEPGRKDRMPDIDGIRAPVAELEYPIDYDSHLKGKIVEFGSTQIGYMEPGASTSVSGQQTTYTPIACGTRYAEGDYLTDVMAVWTRGDGGLFVVKFPTARVIKWKVDAKDKAEGTIEFDIQAYLSLTAAASSTDTCPYKIIDVAAA